ncbi:hypothetical protein KQX54_004003 [Cotesia glomerata]|uniref:EGF-like domain-containing protein n=1 Tax=Cotesia glomerata TaxID=32391 RepID=A0AAV7HCL5_COTGL|nr:hypothetical protein KQX54_004003 [Cotesia glomerata]
MTIFSDTAKLGASCVSDEDCNGIMHAKCSSETKCVCRANNLRLNETYCAPLLGGFCWKNETCVTKNALCIDNECRCRENYSVSEDQCLPVLIGSHCSYDRDCAKIKFAKCSENNYCVCSLNTVVINNILCGSVLNSYCATDSDCLVNNSVCKNNKCQCRPEYVAINRNQCIRPNSGISCTNDDFCKVFMNNAICAENNTCISNQDIGQGNQETYVSLDTIDKSYIGMFCTDDDYCNFYINHTICSPENQCACSQNSYYYKRTVHSLLFNMSVTNDEECKAEQAFCLDNKCYHHSVAGFLDKFCSEDINCFGSLLGELCDIDKDCLPYDSVCSDKKCKCAMNYRNNSIFFCLRSMLNQNCWINSYCSAIRNAECLDFQCKCKVGYVESNPMTCSPLLGTQCTKLDECAVRHSICFDGQCECSDFFTPQSNDRCRSIRLGESCNNNHDCNLIKYAKCSASGKCSCLINYVARNSTSCSPLLDERCQVDDECYVNNSDCIANKCRCRNGFPADGSNSRCQSTMLGKRCNTSEDCSMMKNSVCSSDKICICPSKYFAIGSYFCTPTSNAACLNDMQCSNDLFHCVDGKCQCKSGYTAISVNKCMETSLMYSCKETSECSDSWHWNCATSGKCVCHVDNVAINNSTCLPSLNGFCWRDDQCKAENSVCTDYRCRCKPHFVAVANNHCALPIE